MKQPFVTILVPAYNLEKYIKDSVGSLLAQTYKNIEIIVMNDGSKDRTAEILREFGNKIIFHDFKENRGITPVLRFGLEQAKGDFVMFFDADDLLPPDSIEEYMKFFEEHPEADFAYSNYYAFFEDIKNGLRKYNFNYPREATFARFMEGNFLKFSQVVTRTKFLKDRGLTFDTKIKYGGDWDLWLQVSSSGGKGFLIDKPLLYCCQRLSGLSGSSRGKLNSKKESFYILSKYAAKLPPDAQEALRKRIEHMRIKMLFNVLSADDPSRFSDIHMSDYGSLAGKIAYLGARVVGTIVPPRIIDRFAVKYYRRKEEEVLFNKPADQQSDQ